MNAHVPVTADMALRLAKVFNTSAELWVGLQKQYDLWHAEHGLNNEWQKVRTLPALENSLFKTTSSKHEYRE